MKEDSILICLIAFIIGYFLFKIMGNGFSVGSEYDMTPYKCVVDTDQKNHFNLPDDITQVQVGGGKNCENIKIPKMFEDAKEEWCNQFYDT